MRQQSTAQPVFTRDILERLHAPAPAPIRAFLDEPYSVDPTKIDEYRDKGYVKLEGIITGEPLEYYRELIGLAVGHRFKDDQRALSEKRVYEQSFLQAFNLWPHYPAIAEFVQSIRFADVARRMMRVEGVKLWFDQALYKEPGGRITDYHVDAAFWPVQPAAKTTTIWMALVDVPIERGCMAFATGSHKLSPDAEFVDIFNAQEEIAIGDNVRHYPWEWAPLAQGDCTFHSGLVYHRAGGNSTDAMREAMTIAYMTADARFDWPESNPEAGRRHGFATEGLQRGDLLESSFAPRLI
ncbi:MAG: phytanoyl-CoA dioxygenase family protein [Chloroflexota bacterium]|nr:phytanoyl-CoA dioxygenase family protein [Chloroflexota bacterium]MDE2911273.1 phytanoyl-CoA dioxygenase family protein [Chloroflexota bacterium]